MESYFWQEAADFMSRLIFPYFISSSGTDIFFFFLIFFQVLIGKSPLINNLLYEMSSDFARSCFPWSITSTPPRTRARLCAPSLWSSQLSSPQLVSAELMLCLFSSHAYCFSLLLWTCVAEYGRQGLWPLPTYFNSKVCVDADSSLLYFPGKLSVLMLPWQSFWQ